MRNEFEPNSPSNGILERKKKHFSRISISLQKVFSVSGLKLIVTASSCVCVCDMQHQRGNMPSMMFILIKPILVSSGTFCFFFLPLLCVSFIFVSASLNLQFIPMKLWFIDCGSGHIVLCYTGAYTKCASTQFVVELIDFQFLSFIGAVGAKPYNAQQIHITKRTEHTHIYTTWCFSFLWTAAFQQRVWRMEAKCSE